jgi:hypothetical protein
VTLGKVINVSSHLLLLSSPIQILSVKLFIYLKYISPAHCLVAEKLLENP